MAVPYWRLIAVLQSTLPLDPPLAMRLYHAALDLHRSGDGLAKLSGDLALGQVRRLGREMAMGSLVGPGFEAELDTPRGHGEVRFLLTREGLETDEAQAPTPRPASELN